MSFNNFEGSVAVYGLSVSLGQLTVSSNKKYIEVPYVGKASPDSSEVSLVKYKYSTNKGLTYMDMTPVSDTDTENLSFSELGTKGVFRWDAKKDIGNDLYNKNLLVVLQASGFGVTSSEVSRSVYLSRPLTNVAAEKAKTVFPEDYNGLNGSSYKQKKLPKTN
jgi:hypothetical protein